MKKIYLSELESQIDCIKQLLDVHHATNLAAEKENNLFFYMKSLLEICSLYKALEMYDVKQNTKQYLNFIQEPFFYLLKMVIV